MKRLKCILSLLLFAYWLPAIAQSDIEITDSTSTEWGDNIGGGITPNMPTGPVTSITLSQISITIEGGESIRLTAQTNSTAANKRVIWSVVDESIAAVSNNGTVMGRKKGTTIVTVTSVSNPEIAADCKVTVMSDYEEPNLIVYTDGNGSVTGGGTYMEGTEVTLVAIPNDGYRFVKWSDGSTANPYTFILYGATELMAFFEPIEGEGLGNGRIVSIPGGDYNVFYSDYTGKRWYLHAAGYKNWAVSETPKTIKFTDGNVTDERAYANAASFMESNGYYMSNVEEWDGTGSINTVPVNEGLGLEKRTWESQVFYKNKEDKHAIRLTNTIGTDWGCHLFINIDPTTLEVFASQPSLGDALYQWEIEKSKPVYKVYYYIDGDLVHTVEVVYGEVVPEYVYEPTKEGYTFSGWSGIPEAMPAENVTVTGSFIVNKYLLTYIVDGEVYHTDSIAYGTVMTAIDVPTQEGHTFSGWSGVPSTMPAKDITISGSFTVNSYTVTYMVDGEVYKTESIAYGSSITATDFPVKEGHTFGGWSEIPATMPAENITITGSFAVNSYTMTYMVDGEVYRTESLTYGSKVEVIALPIKEGHTFSGWSGVPATMPAKDVTVSGSFTVNNYTVTYMVDGELYRTEIYAYGSAITATEAPTKEGHTFRGWSEIPSTMPAEDITITGSFTTNSYSITYMVDGEVYKTESYAYGAAITAAEAPTKEGYAFSGWSGVPATMPAKDVTVNGSFTVNSYTVTYMVDGELYKTENYAYGATIAAAEAPTKEGHTFSGWSEIPITMPAGDITITGSFTANNYTITFILEGDVFAEYSLPYGSAIEVPEAPEKEGLSFGGWGKVPETMPAQNLVYEGSYMNNPYTIIYIVDGVEYHRALVEYGSAITLIATPVKEGHTFSGWSEVPETMPAGDITVSGSFTVNSYTIIYYVDGEEFYKESIPFGASVSTIEAPQKEGYTFSGWSEIPATMPAKDLTVNGAFSINTYIVTFMVDGEEYCRVNVVYGEEVILVDTPTKEGHTFSGWGEVPTTMPAKDITINGSFSINSYTVTYVVDGEVYKTESITYGSKLTPIAVPVKEGHTFSGWGGVPNTMPAKDVTINGTFTINTYTITYMVDGEVYQTMIVTYGEAITLIDNPSKEGYTFSGWLDAPERMPAKDVTINGRFVTNGYTVTYLLDGEVYKTFQVEYGVKIPTVEAPSKEGHTFSGWNEVPETMPAKDVIVTGYFTINKYLVTFKVGDEVIAADSLEYGAAIVAPEAPDREGYTFDGWGGVAETVPASDVTYEGTYTVNIYKVYYYVGEELVHTAEVAYGETIPEYVYEPIEESYTFLGWIGNIYETMPAHDVTYTANIDDAIRQLTIDNSQMAIYDFSGRKIEVDDLRELEKGIYIVNGHKVVIEE